MTSSSSLRAVRIIVLAIVAITTTTTTTRVFAQFPDPKPDPGCSFKVSCIECLEAPCTWYGFGTCLDFEPVLMDVPRYSLDDGGTVQSVCETAANDKTDADLCASKLDCQSCFEAVLSDGRGTCFWFGDSGYCGSGCNMMGCGSETCNDNDSGGSGRPPIGAPVASPSMVAAGFNPQPPVGQPVGQPVYAQPVFVRPSGQPVDSLLESETENNEPTDTVVVIPDAADSPPPVEAAEIGTAEPEATDSAAASEVNSGACSSRTSGGDAILLLVLLALVNA